MNTMIQSKQFTTQFTLYNKTSQEICEASLVLPIILFDLFSTLFSLKIFSNKVFYSVCIIIILKYFNLCMTIQCNTLAKALIFPGNTLRT